MGALDKIIQGVTETIKMNDRIISIAGRIQELSAKVNEINERLIRVETVMEFAIHKKLPDRKKEKLTQPL
jgi:hypothetical protein